MSGMAYRHAEQICGACPIEAGLIGNLADHECVHGRLPGDPTGRCGCWAEETAIVTVLHTPLQLDMGLAA